MSSQFDYIECQYALPVAGANAYTYQSKDTPARDMETYTIRADGSLWHGERPEPFEGRLRFYTRTYGGAEPEWLEWKAHFAQGVLQQIDQVSEPMPAWW